MRLIMLMYTIYQAYWCIKIEILKLKTWRIIKSKKTDLKISILTEYSIAITQVISPSPEGDLNR